MLKGLVSYESSDSESESDTVEKSVVTGDDQLPSPPPPPKKTTKINLLNNCSIPELQITKKKFGNDSLRADEAKSGLLNMLPPVQQSPNSKLAPKTSSTKTSLMPTTILKRKNLTDLNDEIESDTIESETLTSFFSFVDSGRTSSTTAAAIPKNIVPDLCSSTIESSGSKSNAYFASLVNNSGDSSGRVANEQDVAMTDTGAESSDMLAQMPLDFRGANGSVSALDIIDVNADEITKENRLLMLRNLTDETTCVGGPSDISSATKKRLKNDGTVAKGGSGSGTADVGSLHRKKHQITYLAQQAIENEQQLKNFWAANRHAQDQSRQKYGF